MNRNGILSNFRFNVWRFQDLKNEIQRGKKLAKFSFWHFQTKNRNQTKKSGNERSISSSQKVDGKLQRKIGSKLARTLLNANFRSLHVFNTFKVASSHIRIVMATNSCKMNGYDPIKPDSSGVEAFRWWFNVQGSDHYFLGCEGCISLVYRSLFSTFPLWLLFFLENADKNKKNSLKRRFHCKFKIFGWFVLHFFHPCPKAWNFSNGRLWGSWWYFRWWGCSSS